MSVEKNRYRNPNHYFKGDIPKGEISWISPSNIALIKYWGKKPVQIPCNPSVSFTLSRAQTKTHLSYQPAKGQKSILRFFFEGKRNELFETKTNTFFDSLLPVFPFISQLDFEIHSENTFPHSAGIASSASGMSALTLCLCDLERKYFGTHSETNDFYRKASYIARLGSGSACRSLYGGMVVWGKTDALTDSSDEYGIPVTEVHPLFQNYRDSILIVDAGSKKVSSRAGHALMNNNPYATIRFEQAKHHVVSLLKAINTGDLETFINITESEALTLHAMMMTSQPYYMLFKPATLAIIDKMTKYRNKTNVPVAFTLDAGPNIHLLYPEKYEKQVGEFIQTELISFLYNGTFINDEVGNGPVRLKV